LQLESRRLLGGQERARAPQQGHGRRGVVAGPARRPLAPRRAAAARASRSARSPGNPSSAR
jgi:hypothetical protein